MKRRNQQRNKNRQKITLTPEEQIEISEKNKLITDLINGDLYFANDEPFAAQSYFPCKSPLPQCSLDEELGGFQCDNWESPTIGRDLKSARSKINQNLQSYVETTRPKFDLPIDHNWKKSHGLCRWNLNHTAVSPLHQLSFRRLQQHTTHATEKARSW